MLEEDFKKKILAEFSDAEANKILKVLEDKDLEEPKSICYTSETGRKSRNRIYL